MFNNKQFKKTFLPTILFLFPILIITGILLIIFLFFTKCSGPTISVTSNFGSNIQVNPGAECEEDYHFNIVPSNKKEIKLQDIVVNTDNDNVEVIHNNDAISTLWNLNFNSELTDTVASNNISITWKIKGFETHKTKITIDVINPVVSISVRGTDTNVFHTLDDQIIFDASVNAIDQSGTWSWDVVADDPDEQSVLDTYVTKNDIYGDTDAVQIKYTGVT